jgi:hypothetical protein
MSKLERIAHQIIATGEPRHRDLERAHSASAALDDLELAGAVIEGLRLNKLYSTTSSLGRSSTAFRQVVEWDVAELLLAMIQVKRAEVDASLRLSEDPEGKIVVGASGPSRQRMRQILPESQERIRS